MSTPISPSDWYAQHYAEQGLTADAAQAHALQAMDALWHELIAFKSQRNQFLGRSLLSPDVPQGLYLWGGVGRGKTFLMDGFFACVPYQRKRRLHFHHFMAEVHHAMKLHAAHADPLIAVADEIAHATRLLCLDEFHIDDIADAMILARLLEALMARGVVLVTTSNQAPDALYAHGLQRQNFLPAIALLNAQLKVLHVDGGHDYRLQNRAAANFFITPNHPASEQKLAQLFQQLGAGLGTQDAPIQLNGRTLKIKKSTRDCVWLSFHELCEQPHDQADYLSLAQQFSYVFVSDIPQLNVERGSAARRFSWLIDVLYDHHSKLIASAAVSVEMLYASDLPAADFARTRSRLIEMQTLRYRTLNPVNFTQ
ncbi:MAG: cell division protein ZapE [Sideroxydans sp.]|nr:cell division protein ZapE [Sideroxydans sp.]